MVAPTTAEENEQIKTTVEEVLGERQRVWLGLEWRSGEMFDIKDNRVLYTSWFKTPGDVDKQCIYMRSSDLAWFAIGCTYSPVYAMCE